MAFLYFDGFDNWAARRVEVLAAESARLTSLATSHYAAALSQLLRARIRNRIVPLLPRFAPDADPSTVLRDWASGPDPARLALLENLLEAVAAEPDSSAALASFVKVQAQTIAHQAGRSAEHASQSTTLSTTISVRIAGTDLQDTLAPVIETVDVISNAVTWSLGSEGFTVTIPNAPHATAPVVAEAYEALAQTFKAPWLGEIQRQLHELLSAIESGVDDSRVGRSALALREALAMFATR